MQEPCLTELAPGEKWHRLHAHTHALGAHTHVAPLLNFRRLSRCFIDDGDVHLFLRSPVRLFVWHQRVVVGHWLTCARVMLLAATRDRSDAETSNQQVSQVFFLRETRPPLRKIYASEWGLLVLSINAPLLQEYHHKNARSTFHWICTLEFWEFCPIGKTEIARPIGSYHLRCSHFTNLRPNQIEVYSVERIYLRQRCFDASKPCVAASTGTQYQYVHGIFPT